MKEKTKKIRLAKKWIDALRSGKYKQGRGQLVKGDRYCCLGVLCDVAKQEFGLEMLEDGVKEDIQKYSEYVPANLKHYLLLDAEIISSYETFQNKLIIMNDGNGNNDNKNKKSFKTIAQFLEDNLLPLLEQED